MFKRFFGSGASAGPDLGEEKGSDFVIEDDDEEDKYQPNSAFMENLRLNMSKMIAYAQSADVVLQREVAEMLANEAVSADRQAQIVEYGGLRLLVPLTKSTDHDVRRLAAHALANLSVNAKNQTLMADEGAVEMLLDLLESDNEVVQRQAAKAVANLGVNQDNKLKIGKIGGIPRLVRLAASPALQVKIEAIAALGNLAVNDFNELEIVKDGALVHLAASAAVAAQYMQQARGRRSREGAHWEELAAQCARCLRNLTVNPLNRAAVVDSEVVPALKIFSQSTNDRIAQQSSKALRNLAAANTSISLGSGTDAVKSREDAAGGSSRSKGSGKGSGRESKDGRK